MGYLGFQGILRGFQDSLQIEVHAWGSRMRAKLFIFYKNPLKIPMIRKYFFM